MTAPDVLTSINAHIAQIQARIAAVCAPPASSATGTAPGASTGSAAQFASVLAGSAPSATGASGIAYDGAATGADVVADAKTYLGTPYVYGGESKSGIDCSGLVQSVYKHLGIDLPRVAADQQNVGTDVPSLAQAQPGDLLFFGRPAHHVAIYLGNNQLIESPEPGKTVHIIDVYRTPTSIKRIVPGGASGVAGLTGGIAVSSAHLIAAGVNPSVAAYAAQFADAETQFRLPSGMLAAVAQQESGGNPRAVSPAGAQGLMQLMPSTAAGLGVNAMDPSQAIPAAAKILSRNLAEFGNSVPLALAAYNAGAGAVKQYGGVPPYTETQNYVRSITALMERGA